MGNLKREDIVEPRPKCPICGYELTFAEFIVLKGYCVFHAKEGMKELRRLSKLKYVNLLMADLDLARAKIKAKNRGLSEIDFQSCVGTVARDLEDLTTVQDIRKVIDTVRKHKGVWEPI